MARSLRVFIAALLIAALAPAAAPAQSYPQRPVRFILPFGPAAGVDITARLIGDRLATRWGKAVVVENRPGGDGLVAINAFTSAADDHTLLFAPASTFTAHPYTQSKLPYDLERDLLPIANVTVIVIALVAPASLNIATLADFVALARAKPGTLSVAAAAGNSDMILAAFLKQLGLDVAKAPYRDIMQAPNDLAEGRIQLLMSSYASMRPLIEAGKLKVLAVTSRRRVAIAPGIPTVAEAGFPFLGLDSLIGLYGPRGMASALRESIAADVRRWSPPIPPSPRGWRRRARWWISAGRAISPRGSRPCATSWRRSPTRSESRRRIERGSPIAGRDMLPLLQQSGR
jgi:tripartite-type tricarboxylate transporter receptor subunit TctC